MANDPFKKEGPVCKGYTASGAAIGSVTADGQLVAANYTGLFVGTIEGRTWNLSDGQVVYLLTNTDRFFPDGRPIEPVVSLSYWWKNANFTPETARKRLEGASTDKEPFKQEGPVRKGFTASGAAMGAVNAEGQLVSAYYPGLFIGTIEGRNWTLQDGSVVYMLTNTDQFFPDGRPCEPVVSLMYWWKDPGSTPDKIRKQYARDANRQAWQATRNARQAKKSKTRVGIGFWTS